MSDTTRKRSGTSSISFIPQGWQAIYLARPGDTFSTSTYSGVEFYINGAPNGGQQIRVGFRQNSNEYGSPTAINIANYIDGATTIGNTWRRVYVPFSAMNIGPGDNLMAVTIQSETSTAQARVYIDDVRLICVGTGTPVATPVTPPVSPPPGFAWTGVNIAGAEFGGFSFWPTTQDMDYFAGKGMNVFRVPFEWTRLQPILSQPFDATEENGLDSVVQYATVTKGVYVIIDPHKYDSNI